MNIKAGNYSRAVQDIQDVPALDSCTSSVVFVPAPGVAKSAVVFGIVEAGDLSDYNTNGASNWTLKGVTVTRLVALYPPARSVTINNIQGGGLYINGVDGLTVENSNLGPCYSGRIVAGKCSNNIKIDTGWRQGSGQTYTTSNVTFLDNSIHDFINNGKTHFECMFIVGGTNINIDSNKFIGCQNYAIFMQNFRGTPFTNLVIQNNSFAETLDDAGSTQYAVDFGGTGHENNVLIRYNSFAPNEGVTADGAARPGTNDWVIGNVGGNDYYTKSGIGCISGLSYAYNMWNRVKCGPGDTVRSTLPYVSAAAGKENFHLITESHAHDLVTPNTGNYRLDYDKDGDPRPPRGPRDAGAQEQTPWA